MQINLTGHHVDITEPLRNYVNEKFERLERHFDNGKDVNVVLSVEKLRHTAEATMHITGGKLSAVPYDLGQTGIAYNTKYISKEKADKLP